MLYLATEKIVKAVIKYGTQKLLFATILIIFSAVSTWAAEVTYTSRAQITGSDLRAAQKNSLNNALLGGIRKYIQDNAPEHKGEINKDYFMFIDSYTVISRTIVNNYVQTTVRIV